LPRYFPLALIRPIRYGKPSLIIAGGGAYTQEGKGFNPSNLLGREIVKLDESCGRQMGTDDDVMLGMLGIL